MLLSPETRTRTAVEALAPTVPPIYRLASATLDANDLGRTAAWLATNPQITQGEQVRRIEEAWSAWLGRRHTAFVSSGTTANEVAARAAMETGRVMRRVVVQAAGSWVTTISPWMSFVHPLTGQPIDIIMCGNEYPSLGIDIRQLEQICERERPDAVVCVPTFGVPSDMGSLLALKERYGFFLFEDGCSSTGSSYRGRKIGTFGDVATNSFYFGHQFAAGEGGTISTDDEALHLAALMYRSHGWGKDLPAEAEQRMWETLGRAPLDEDRRIFTFYVPGTNARNTEIGARLGLTQFDKVDWLVQRRIENQVLYEARLQGQPGLFLPHNPEGIACTISCPVLAASPAHRHALIETLRAEGVETRVIGGGSMGRQPFWTRRFGVFRDEVADAVEARSFVLPNNADLAPADIHRICDIVLDVPLVHA